VTIPAIARLQGFPQWYQLSEVLAISGQMLGYSVPPLFATQLFKHLLAQITNVEAIAELRNSKSCQSPLTDAESTCGLSISFGWTAQYLPDKTVTRRDWKDSHTQKFIKAFERGDRLIWEYRYCNQNYYVAVGRFGRIKNGIINGLSGDRILKSVFNTDEESLQDITYPQVCNH
jgi:hypothetical protein